MTQSKGQAFQTKPQRPEELEEILFTSYTKAGP